MQNADNICIRLSIITINRNNAAGLKKTIQSVVDQTATDFEYIIIDGASEDASIDVIKKYVDRITYWISEPDSGIYNAMNKGIRKAQGDYCLFLNSGDRLLNPSTLSDVFNEINNLEDADIYYSDCVNNDNSIAIFPKQLDAKYLISKYISHQNSLIKRKLFLNHGFYNEEIKIASDWGFFLKECWTYKSKFIHLNTCISLFDILTGVSKTEEEKGFLERDIIIKDIFNDMADIVIEWKNRFKPEYIIANIKHRGGLGLRFVFRCLLAWVSREKYNNHLRKVIKCL